MLLVAQRGIVSLSVAEMFCFRAAYDKAPHSFGHRHKFFPGQHVSHCWGTGCVFV
jgi:hypothetical protein